MQTYSLNLIKLLAENAFEGIILLDSNGLVRYTNPSIARMFNYSNEELEGQPIATLIEEMDENNFMIENLDIFSKNIFGIGNQHKGKRKDSTNFIFDLNIVEVNLEDGEKMFLYRMHDISSIYENSGKEASITKQLMLANTDLKNKISNLAQTEYKLRNNIKELLSAKEFNKNLNDVKSVFISTVSDNFRSPLSSILSSAQLISKYQKTEEQKNRERHLKKIENTVSNLNNTLSELLSCKQLEEDKLIFNSEEFDIRDLVNDVIAESKFIEKKDTEVLYEHDGDGTHIITDQAKLRDIIENLVTNALKYSNGKGVNVYSKFQDEKLLLKVKDHGIGIPITDQPNIFRRFYRAGNVAGTKGNGIGLSIVKKYVDSMNGHIQLHSEVNQGTEFNVALPAIIVQS
jgi:two-component system sensor kinase FixL